MPDWRGFSPNWMHRQSYVGDLWDNSIEKDVSVLRLLQNAVQLSDVLYLLRRELGDACDEIERHFLL